MLERMISFQAAVIHPGELIIRKGEFRQQEANIIKVFIVLVVLQATICLSIYSITLSRYWYRYYDEDDQIENYIGTTALVFFSI